MADSSGPVGGFHRLTTITVTFNSAPFIGAALESVRVAAREAGLDLEVLVIDNASSDDTVAVVARRFPSAHVVANPQNVGFAAANNQALDLATGDVIVLVNPDAVVEADCFVHLVRFLATHPAAAAVGPRVGDWSGKGPESAGMSPGIRSMAGHFLLLNRLLPGARGGSWQGWQLASRPHLGPRRVDWVGGTVVALRPDAFRAVGGFDPSYFMYFEDVDLGRRLWARGWELWLEPAALARHQISHGRISTAWLDAMQRYVGATGGRPRLIVVSLIVAAGLAVRAGVRTVASTTEADGRQAARARANARHAVGLLGSAVKGGGSPDLR